MEVYILWKVKFCRSASDHKLYGPYCPVCGVLLTFDEKANFGNPRPYQYQCRDCNIVYDLPYWVDYICEEVDSRVFAKEIQKYTPINLDLPPTKLQTRAEDDKYFIGAYLTQKDGRRVAVVYVGEKMKNQKKHDYSQVFVDLDQKQIRYDVTNKNPKELLAAFAAEFDDGTVHEVRKKK